MNLKNPCVYYDFYSLFQSPNTEIIVAQHENKLVGSGYAKIVNTKPYHINQTYAYMGFMFIDPKYRGQGIIQNIIETLKNWAKTKNVIEARLMVYNENTGAIKAYEKSGFKKHMLEMKLHFD
ncbi:GNAT family N-acetyltransferase [Lacinutrix sp. Hel_I_90]|uniref:GNAT family N-acetyltransferase n=1 Tax=Lacinutrix sp. Hel_I_90 TaxID=1249999 RepID=UPI000A518F15|nr:GNAT family N-acetyltransferase [Lacinutrix sp. Hel_I_90]